MGLGTYCVSLNQNLSIRKRIVSRPHSIRTRLMALYVASATAMFALGVVFLQWSLASSLQDEDVDFLSQKIRTIGLVLVRHPGNTSALHEEIEWDRRGLQYTPYFARVVNTNGQTETESAGMRAHLSVTFPPPQPINSSLRVTKVQTTDHHWYLLASRWDRGSGTADRHVIDVALDVSHEEAISDSYRRKVALMFLFGILASAVVSSWVARRSLAPIADITEATCQVNISRLGVRIAAAGWPQELDDLARAFDTMLDRLEDSFQRLAQFSADIAHELRTPVGNARGEAEIALTQQRTPDEYRHVIESSLEEYERLSQMIDGLLFLARAESSNLSLRSELLDARFQMSAVQEYFAPVTDEQGVSLSVEGEANITADSMLLRRAVSNLVANSLNNTPCGGVIFILLSVTSDGGCTVVVADSGTGIEPKHLARVFDRFYQCDPARSRECGGSGLGLSIVRSIMDAHNGTVCLESDLVTGTRVTLYFPPPAAH